MAHVYEVKTWLHNSAGNFFQNVFHFNLTESGTANPYKYARELLVAHQTNQEAQYLGVFGSDVTLDFYSARKLTGGGGPSAQIVVNNAGSALALCISSGIGGDVVWIVDSATHRFAHTFLGGAPSGSIVGDVWGAGYTADVQSWADQMIIPLTLAGGLGSADFGLYSRKTTLFSIATEGQLRPKPVLLNKRTVPIL